MKLLLILSCLSSCSWPLLLGTPPKKAPSPKADQVAIGHMKKNVAILAVVNESPYGGEDLSRATSRYLKKKLFQTQELIIHPEGEKLFGHSKEVYSGGGSQLMKLAPKAKAMGIHLVLFGRIISAQVREKTGDIGLIRKTQSLVRAKVELRMFDINSTKEIYSQTLTSTINDGSYNFFASGLDSRMAHKKELAFQGAKLAVDKFIGDSLEAARKLDWVGRVAKIVGQKIYINSGRESGLQISDILKVTTEGQEIFDPETGQLIGISQGEVKGTLQIVDYFGPNGSIAILHSGGPPQEGDYVTLY